MFNKLIVGYSLNFVINKLTGVESNLRGLLLVQKMIARLRIVENGLGLLTYNYNDLHNFHQKRKIHILSYIKLSQCKVYIT